MNIKIEEVEFPKEMKDRLIKMINKKVELEFVSGREIDFENIV